MNVGHSRWFGAFKQHNRSMRTSSECRGLWKQPAIYERGREVGVRLPLNHDTAIDEIVADRETLQLNIEVAAVPCEINQSGVPFRKVDTKQMSARTLQGRDRIF
jgi:hypothetical protein